MFLTSAIAWIIIVAEFVFGCFVGLLVAAILRRSNLPFGVATRAACIAGFALLLSIGFENGHATAVGPAGEVLPLRTLVAHNGYLIAGGACILAAITTVLLSPIETDRSLEEF
jgi:hypothetical protein